MQNKIAEITELCWDAEEKKFKENKEAEYEESCMQYSSRNLPNILFFHSHYVTLILLFTQGNNLPATSLIILTESNLTAA